MSPLKEQNAYYFFLGEVSLTVFSVDRARWFTLSCGLQRFKGHSSLKFTIVNNSLKYLQKQITVEIQTFHKKPKCRTI